jgi:hypothetical protein
MLPSNKCPVALTPHVPCSLAQTDFGLVKQGRSRDAVEAALRSASNAGDHKRFYEVGSWSAGVILGWAGLGWVVLCCPGDGLCCSVLVMWCAVLVWSGLLLITSLYGAHPALAV